MVHKPTKIYIIRHAEAEGNAYRRCHGQYDSLLTKKGEYQVGALSERFSRVPIDAVRMARKKMWVRHDKARHELGFSPGPAETALRQAVQWFAARQAAGNAALARVPAA